jgi:CubicO group peptidase (beta-lactamase class C family)
MIKQLFFVCFLFFANISFSQSEKYNDAFALFKTHFNTNEFEQIFNAFSPEMQQALVLEDTKQFLNGLKSLAGNLNSGELIKVDDSGFALYKSNFEQVTLGVHLSVDDQQKINGLYVKPYEEASTSKTINGLSKYPTEIGNLVFEHTKDFPVNTQLSIAIIKDGKVSYYGVINDQETLKPIKNDKMIFEIGSITKVFTSTILASLVNEKKLDFNSSINPYFSFKFLNNHQFSFLSLANHTSGLPRLPDNFDFSNDANPYKNYKTTDLHYYLENLIAFEQTVPFKYDYSNLGTAILGHSLALSQNSSYKQLLTTHVLAKYKMKNTFTEIKGIEKRLVKGLDETGSVTSNWEFEVMLPAGGILSNVRDLVKFTNAQFDESNETLAITRTERSTVNGDMKIGLGWHILNSKLGEKLFWHNGGTGGYTSSMVFEPTHENAVVILSNVSGGHPNRDKIDTLAFELMKFLEEK